MTVYTYQHGAEEFAPQEQAPQGRPAVRINADAGQSTSVIVRNGEAVTEHNSAGRVTSAELNPYFGTDSVFATAKSMHGIGVQEIGPDTLITVNGVQGQVKFFEQHGLIHKTDDGYAEGSGEPQGAPQQSPEADTADDLSMPAEVAAAVDQALEGVADHNLTPLVGLGIGVVTGQVDRARLEQQMAQFSGASPEEAAARVQAGFAAYQQQADSAITSRSGVAEADLPAFYAWAKESQAGALRGAVEKQIHQNDFSGYRALAARFLADNPPTIEAVQAGGYETRQHGDKAEVLVDGRWMTIQTAARLGYF